MNPIRVKSEAELERLIDPLAQEILPAYDHVTILKGVAELYGQFSHSFELTSGILERELLEGTVMQYCSD